MNEAVKNRELKEKIGCGISGPEETSEFEAPGVVRAFA